MDTIGVTLALENNLITSVSIDKQATNEGKRLLARHVCRWFLHLLLEIFELH